MAQLSEFALSDLESEESEDEPLHSTSEVRFVSKRERVLVS